MSRPNHFDVIDKAPVLMTWSERVVLYATVIGLRPKRVLEIGTHRGGSAAIIVAAMDDLGEGLLCCVDPQPVIDPAHWATIAHRATLFTGGSPAILSETTKAAGGSFDLAFIDGDHEEPGVVADIEGTIPLLADSAYMIFHDAHYPAVERGIDRVLKSRPGRLVDCGMLSVERTPDANHPEVGWGGLRLVKFERKAIAGGWMGRLGLSRKAG